MDKKELLRTIKFTLISVSAGIVQALSETVLGLVFKMAWGPRYIIALVLSVIWNFTINRKVTFKSANNVPIAMAKVFAFYLVFTPATYFLGKFLGNIGVNEVIVTAINMVLNLVLEYFYDKYYVFKGSIDSAK